MKKRPINISVTAQPDNLSKNHSVARPVARMKSDVSAASLIKKSSTRSKRDLSFVKKPPTVGQRPLAPTFDQNLLDGLEAEVNIEPLDAKSSLKSILSNNQGVSNIQVRTRSATKMLSTNSHNPNMSNAQKGGFQTYSNSRKAIPDINSFPALGLNNLLSQSKNSIKQQSSFKKQPAPRIMEMATSLDPFMQN